MRLLIPIHELRYRLEELDHVFFFLKNGIESAIIHAFEEYEYPKRYEYDSFFGDDEVNYILLEFERHVDTIAISNACYKNLNRIYDSLLIAIIDVKREVNHVLKTYMGDQHMKVMAVNKINPYTCLLEVDIG